MPGGAKPPAEAEIGSIPIPASLAALFAALLAAFFTPSPAVPTLGAAPSQTTPPIVSAPVPARAVPTVPIPAVPPAFVDELGFLQNSEAIGSRPDRVEVSGCRLHTSVHQGATCNQSGHRRTRENKFTHVISLAV